MKIANNVVYAHAFAILCLVVLLLDSLAITSVVAEPVKIIVNENNVVSIASFTQGIQFDYYDWSRVVVYKERQIYLDYLKAMNCGIVRIFVFRQSMMNPDIPATDTINYMGPCTSWDSTNHVGVFNWDNMDKTIDAIRSIGAEPLLVLMNPSSSVNYQRNPRGMKVDSNGLPFPDDYAAYCAQFAERYKGKVRFYEVMNEPFHYWGWNADRFKVRLLLKIYDACYDKIKGADPSSLVSFDSVQMEDVFNFMKTENIPFDFYDFHKYGSNSVDDKTDSVLRKAGDTFLSYNGGEYSLVTMRQKNDNDTMISFCSESNFSSAWMDGTDIRNTQSEGVCFAGLQTIYALEIGLNYRIHYLMSGSKRSSSEQPSGGWGFGIVNTDDDSPLLPYYFYKLIGQNLSVGDKIVETISTSPNILAVSWIHNGVTKSLIVNKGSSGSSLSINFSGEFTKIDDTYYGSRTGTYVDSVTMEPYSTMLVSGANVKTYNLSIQPPSGSGSTNPNTANYTLAQGSEVTVTAQPSQGWALANWILNGTDRGKKNPLNILMNGSQTLKAVFKPESPITSNRYVLTVMAPVGLGETTPSQGIHIYQQIETVNISATPADSWKFDHWIIEGSPNTTQNSYKMRMDANLTIRAVFKQNNDENPGWAVPGLIIVVAFVGFVLCTGYLLLKIDHRTRMSNGLARFGNNGHMESNQVVKFYVNPFFNT